MHVAPVRLIPQALLLLGIVAASAACTDRPQDAPAASVAVDDPHAAHAAAASEPESPPTPSGRVSLFDLRGEWTDQAGRTAALGARPRRPITVVTMLYTNCTVSCPRILIDLKRIESRLPAERLADVRFLIASLDPARDTPERLTQWAQDVQLDTARFTLLTAPDETVRELASVLRVRYVPEPNGEFGHTNRLVVLDRDGMIVHRQAGLGAGADETIALIAGAASSN